MEVGCLKVEGEKVRARTMRRQTAPSRGRTLAATGRDISAEFELRSTRVLALGSIHN